MKLGRRKAWFSLGLRYGVAIFSAVLAVSLKIKFNEFEHSTIPVLFLAITVSSCFGGRGPGLVASAIICLAHLYYFIPPVDSFAIQSSEAAIEFVLFAIGSILISSFTASLYETKERLRIASLEIMESAQQKFLFVSNVTHEIRTPINAIVGLSRILADEEANPADRPFLIQNIQDASQILLSQVSDVLDYSKLEYGKFNLVDSTFNLPVQVRRAIDLVKPLAKSKGLQFILNVDPNLPELVMGDLNRILQILWNLLSNAIKFTSSGDIQVNLIKETDLGQELKVRFEVVDSGVGIDELDQESIFLPFMQAEHAGSLSFGGTGLGLSICKKLVQLMDGEIGLVSQKNSGSTFWFRLKLKKMALSNVSRNSIPGNEKSLMAYSATSGKSIPVAADGIAPRILAVDDNELNILVLKKYAQKLGYKIDVAADSIDAISLCAKNKYVAVLMDCQMPQLDGYAVSRAIRALKDSELRAVPIIATTAYVSQEVQIQCRAAGMNDYMPKPLDLDELEAKLKYWSAHFKRDLEPGMGSFLDS